MVSDGWSPTRKLAHCRNEDFGNLLWPDLYARELTEDFAVSSRHGQENTAEGRAKSAQMLECLNRGECRAGLAEDGNWSIQALKTSLKTSTIGVYADRTMVSRDELKAVIDQLPENKLEMVRTMLDHNVNPPPPEPQIEEMQGRSQSYKSRVEARFRETRKPGTIGGLGGGGFAGMHEFTPYGRHGFSMGRKSAGTTDTSIVRWT